MGYSLYLRYISIKTKDVDNILKRDDLSNKHTANTYVYGELT